MKLIELKEFTCTANNYMADQVKTRDMAMAKDKAYSQKLIFFFTISIVLLLFFSANSYAATFTVTKTADTNDGSCDVSDCSLREAIAAANAAGDPDIVSIPSGTYTITRSGSDNSNVNGDFDITNPVNIVGAGSGSTIIRAGIDSASAIDRIFHITNSSAVTIEAVKVQYGKITNYGGCIYANADITVKDSIVDSCTANGTRNGGGIYSGGTVTIDNSTISNSTATDNGGGIHARGVTIIGNTTFSDNSSSDNGGAIFNRTNPLSINGTVLFDNNDAGTASGDRGGAIYSNVNVVLNDVSGSSTIQNSQAYEGGAIYLGASATLTATSATFSGNWSQYRGGAIRMYGGTLTNVTFTNNYTVNTDGGAIYNGTNLLTINGSSNTFTNNYAGTGSGDQGGVIYSTGSLTISNTDFTGRTGTNIDAYDGGAIFITNGDTLTISDSSFDSFRVENRGGAIYTYGGTMTNVTFTDNLSNTNDGGAIYNVTNLLTINGSSNTFTGNYVSNGSGDQGGSIRSSGNLTISNAAFAGRTGTNIDAYDGGAIFITNGDTLTISDSSFDSFRVVNRGGAIFTYGGTMTNVTFTDNLSNTNDGGAIWNQNYLLTINGSSNTFTGNYVSNGSGDQGGSIRSSGNLTISNTDFTGRTGTDIDAYDGGAIWIADGDIMTLSDSTFDSFRVQNVGGAIRMHGGTLTNVTFTDNLTNTNDGGAIYNSSYALTINGTNTFTNNDAGTGSGDRGGMIYTTGSLTLSGATISNSSAYEGGAIYITSGDTLTITDSTFDSNTAGSIGGAIRSYGGTITASTFSNNSTTGGGQDGGAIYSSSTLNVTNSTFSANSVTDKGGAIFQSGNSTIKNSTFYNNTAGTGEAIYENSGAVTVENTIVAKSTSSSSLCYNVGSNDYNIQYNGTCFTAQGNDLSSDPKLNALADNGGPTRTHALQSSSPAIDAANNTTCAASPVSNVDQRGTSRPLDGDTVAGAICDIGAFEAPTYVAPYFSGSIYSDEGTTKITASTTVNLIINGVSAGTDTTTTGDYSISPSSFSAGDKILVYIDNDGTNDGNTITVSDGSTLTGLDIYKDRVIVRQDNSGSLTNANMGSAWISDAGDILYSVDGSNNLTVTGTELFVWSGDTFVPGATVTAVDIDINGTLTAAANAINVSGSWDATGGVFTSTGSTVTLNGTADQTVTSSGQTFNNLTLNNTGTAGSDDIIITDALDINGTLTITNGDLDIGTNDPTVNTAGTVSIASAGSLDVTSRTANWTFDGTSTLTDSSSGQDFEDVVLNGTSLTLGSNMKVQTMTNTAGTLGLGSSDYILEIDGTGAPLSNSGTFTVGTSTVKYTGTGSATNIATVPYSSLQLTPTAATTYSLTGNLTGGNAMTANLTVDSNATLDAVSGSNYNLAAADITINGTYTARTSTITISGNWDSSAGTFNYDTSTLMMTGTGKTLKPAGGWANRIYNLTITNGANITHTGGVFGIENDITLEDNATLNLTIHTFHSMVSGTGDLVIGTGATLDIKYKFYHFISDSSSHISTTGTIESANGTGMFLYSAMTGSTAAPVTARSYDIDVAVTGAEDAISVLGGGGSLNLGSHNLYLWDKGQLFSIFGTLDNSSNIPIVSTGTLEIADQWDNGTFTGKLIARSASYQFGSVILRKSAEIDGVTGSGASTWAVSGNVTMNNSSTFNAGGSTWTIGGNWTRNGGTFNAGTSTVTLNGTGQAITGSTTFNNLTKSVAAADTLTFEAGQTTTIASGGTVTLNGASGQLLTLASSTGSSAWNFNVTSGATKNIDYVSVSWSDASGSHSTQKPITPTNSTDGGNNTDWFGGSPTITVTKLSVVISDPVNSTTNPKRIPGAVIEYSISPSNTGDASPDANSTYVTDIIDTGSVKYDVTTGVSFTDGSTSSALALGSTTYSSTAAPGPYVYDYSPSADGDGCDSNVTSIKVTTTGTFTFGGSPAPSFTFKYRVRVK